MTGQGQTRTVAGRVTESAAPTGIETANICPAYNSSQHTYVGCQCAAPCISLFDLQHLVCEAPTADARSMAMISCGTSSAHDIDACKFL